MSQTLEKILEELNDLSEADRQELVAILHGIKGSATASSAEHEFEIKLAAEGWLSRPVPPPPDAPPFQLGSPLAARGRPLSEILIEERR